MTGGTIPNRLGLAAPLSCGEEEGDLGKPSCKKKSRKRETSNLSTDADRRTDTILESLHDLSRKKNI